MGELTTPALLSPGMLCGPRFGEHSGQWHCPCWLCWEPDLLPPVCPLFLSWGVPLAITVAAVALKKIGYDASDVSVGWCWIDLEAEDRILWMLLTGKLWEMLAYVTLPVLYLLIRKHINRAVGTCLPPPHHQPPILELSGATVP